MEFIHVSAESKADTEKWAVEENFPWPIVLQKDIEKAGLGGYEIDGYPTYLVVNPKGDVIHGGKERANKMLEGK